MDWASALNIGQAVENLRHEQSGDWYRDPWNWPEFDYLKAEGKSLVVEQAQSGPGRLSKLDVPKEGFGSRPAVVMNPLDRVAYQAMTDVVSKRATTGMNAWVHGWRLPRELPEPGRYADQSREWLRLQLHHFELSKHVLTGLKTDLTSFFASIPVPELCESLQRRAPGAISVQISRWLSAWSTTPNRRGLPQRSTASAILANMYLEPLDALIQDHVRAETPAGAQPLPRASRWMDDVWVLGSNEARLRNVQLALTQRARLLGLELNQAKTMVLSGPALVEELGRLSMSGVDFALHMEDEDWRPFHATLERVLSNPAAAERSVVRFLTTRIKNQSLSSDERRAALKQILEHAEHLPHVADHLSRACRDLKLAPERRGWFVDYCRSEWGLFDWSKAQWMTAFPSKIKSPDDLIAIALEWIHPGAQVDCLATAIQRLSIWSPDIVRDALIDMNDRANHPFERRILGLAAVSLGMPRRLARSYLSSYRELTPTLRMVEARDFKPLTIAKDFSGS